MIGSWLLPIPFFTSFKLVFLGVKVVTDFFGVLMEVGSLMFGLFYYKIRNVTLPTFPWKGIWKVKVPKRVAFFMWTTTHGQILTLDNLMLRGRILANCCRMCCCNEESMDHLLISCLVAHSL